MTLSSWAFADGVSAATVYAVCALLSLSLALLVIEHRFRERGSFAVLASGIFALLLFGAALLRPARVATRGAHVGAPVVVLLDESRRLLLPEAGRTRRELGLEAVKRLTKHFGDARISVLGFGDGEPSPLVIEDALAHPEARKLADESDLAEALRAVRASPGERPKAIVVVSDGRFARPTETLDDAALGRVLGVVGAPIHTISVAEQAPRDASIRSVRAAGAAVAHQPLALTVEIGCAGGLECGEIPVLVRELRSGVEPAVLATGVARMTSDTTTVELTITLERAGARVVEVSIVAPDADKVPENDKRTLTFSVARDRVRLLHVAGRPTYDVRALRMWLKADASVDLVAFFILRTDQDRTETSDDSELALIPFPVDELFTEHLPSFDAVILQDIDAVAYKLERHLSALESYVRAGGGLILVGGPAAFAGGGYAGSPLESVLPIALDPRAKPFDTGDFVPRYTEAGRAAPALRGLVELFGDELPVMGGSNTLGKARDGALVLWEHPERRAGDRAMPVLAFGEVGDGRSIALGIDGTHALSFSEFAERAAGRAYGALWDGLVGWLMRDPRYESARMELAGACIAGSPATLRLLRLPGAQGDVDIELERLGGERTPALTKTVHAPAQGPLEIDLGALADGGYSARARVGKAPPTRLDFACERGGAAWSDSRPDPERLRRISRLSGGRSTTQDRVEALPVPAAVEVTAERKTLPLLPAWGFTLLAACALGAHWLLRRKSGLV